jgi:putative transposase
MKTYNDSHSVHEIAYHIIWCTKYRHKVLTGLVDIELKKFIAEACQEYDWRLEKLETDQDHVHIFVRTDHMTAPIEIAKTLKSLSAVHLFAKFPTLKGQKFWGSGLWSRSTYYGAVGHVNEATVKKYIEDQKVNSIHPPA